MTLITERDEIRTVAARWAAQYDHPRWKQDQGKRAIGEALKALNPETATRQDVAKIIGNDSWIRSDCDECKCAKTTLVHIGDQPDYDARWQKLCVECLSKAMSLLNGAA